MKKSAFLLNIMLLFSLCSLAQDTTGGTRPAVIIPLHRNKEKKNAVPLRAAPDNRIDSIMKTSAPLNADDRKLKRAKKRTATRKP